MKDLQHFLICLDGTPLDDQIVSYSSMIAEMVGCTKATFIHAGESNDAIRIGIEERVVKFFSYDVPFNIDFVKGASASAVLNWGELKNVDLIIMGIKPKSMSSGKYAAKVLNGSLCSVLLVPTHIEPKLEKVLIPVDFSGNSLNSIKLAQTISKERKIDILLQHVYYVPIGYSSTGKSYEEFAAIMCKNAEKDFDDFAKRNELSNDGFNVIYTLDEDDSHSDKIYEAAQYEKCDMILLGSVARTKAASLILRSTSVDLLKYDENTPVMVVKNKEESVKFFDALLKI
ncbi:universal stress protein [Reichenbachiella versicolor]|uniref:universal stress protein n=1 Tax=Reichenbachiella versicolor TaxID=1821036 RepID=UPI000D6E192B|nr:universal stress protein [Reichenbachiella versicolor]